jgi:hypothetical protein
LNNNGILICSASDPPRRKRTRYHQRQNADFPPQRFEVAHHAFSLAGAIWGEILVRGFDRSNQAEMAVNGVTMAA